MRLDGRNMARRFYVFARECGFEARDPFYIQGEFRATLADGTTLYTDEAHLWCEDCAKRLLGRYLAEVYGPYTDEHAIYPVDISGGEDSPAHCRDCGETLDHLLTDYGVRQEVAHYEEYASADVNPAQAWELGCLLDSAPSEPSVMKIGAAHLELIDAGKFVDMAAHRARLQKADGP